VPGVGFVVGFVPWIVFWVLVGNAPFWVATGAALALAVGAQLVGWRRGAPRRTLEVGNLGVFAVLAVAAFVVPDEVLERWLQPLGNAGLLLIAVVGVLIGRPFVREYAEGSVDAATARSDGFRVITTGMTWLWVVIFAGMTVSSLVPPLVDGAATVSDSGHARSVICYWVVPFTLTGLGALISALFPPWFQARTALLDARTGTAAGVVAQPAAPADVDAEGIALDVPAVSRHDEPFPVAVRGVSPGASLEARATGVDLAGRAWCSSAGFTVPGSGDAGDWTAAAPDALLWAMRFAQDGATPEMFVPPAEPWAVTVEVRVGDALIRRTVRRRAADESVRMMPVDVAGMPAVLASPARAGPGARLPAVACFGGSEGGCDSQVGHAALPATHGFVALAATWIAEDEAAVAIARVPVERFTAALAFLAAHESTAGPVAAMAISRGAEGLLAAVASDPATTPAGLVLVSPSSVTWQAIGAGGEVPDTASFTAGGRPVPWRPLPTGVLMPQQLHNAWRVHREVAAHRPSLLRLRPAYAAGLAAASEGSEIAAERVEGPLLCLTGSDDQVWPSGEMATALLDRRRRAGIGDRDRHVAYPDAGHLIRLAVLPTDAPWTGGIAFGGTPAGAAAAQRAAIPTVLEFLADITGPAGRASTAEPKLSNQPVNHQA
jgi:BAAT / Acyl-CoA thioester hydrolase C terminal/Acyl-CoA thioester hydrolase/BAAT N-terminal region